MTTQPTPEAAQLTRKQVEEACDSSLNNDWATQQCINYAKLTRKLNELIRALAVSPLEAQAKPERTPGEEAWLDELETATCYGAREKLRTILRAYRANLLTNREAAPSAGEQAAGQREELTGHDLAGCADRAGVVLKVYERQRGYVMPRADDWNRFAKEVRALRGAGQPEGSGK